MLLLPGMMCDYRLWAEQIKYFSSEYAIYVPEISKHRKMESYGREILENLPANEFLVAGLSMGGILAMELLRLDPKRISAVALLDTNHRSELPVRQEMRMEEIERVQNGGLRDIVVNKMKPAYLIPGRYYRPELSKLILNMALEQGVDCFVNQSLALRDRVDYTEVIKKISCPTLIAYGEKDMMCPPSCHHEIYGLLREDTKDVSILAEIKDSGHLITMEQPEETNKVLREWLTGTVH